MEEFHRGAAVGKHNPSYSSSRTFKICYLTHIESSIKSKGYKAMVGKKKKNHHAGFCSGFVLEFSLKL